MNSLIDSVTLLLSLGTVVMQVLALLLLLSLLLKKDDIKKAKGLGAFVQWISRYVLELGFLISLGAVLASMFYSTIAGYAPCEFCWWQRVLIYPQAIMFAVALYYKRKKKNEHHAVTLSTSIILSGLSALLGAFQYYGSHFNPSLLDACVANGPSCAKQYFVSFGYIDIPMMAVTTAVLLVLLVVTHKRAVKIQSAKK
jgi:disulfide bond formation protein DsbB